MTAASPPLSSFAALGIDSRLCGPLAALGYEEPTPIQRAAIPPLLGGRDLLGQAATGTGKTAAFALPLLHRLAASRPPKPGVRGLVLVPTRELAMQVAEAFARYGQELGLRAVPIYGGESIGRQARALTHGVDIVVATPGRALDHLRRKTLRLDQVQVCVLDEADEMLDMGFAEDLEALLAAVPTTRQMALFSATFPRRLGTIVSGHLRDAVRIDVPRETAPKGAPAKVRHKVYVVPRAYKVEALARILESEAPASALVFCRTRTEVDALAETLSGRGMRAEAIHGGLSQDQRDRVMRRFRDGTSRLLVATDVAARGLDIQDLSHVINYDVPSSLEAYLHRTGRTGRAGRTGVAITLAEPREQRWVAGIAERIKRKIEPTPLPTVAELRKRRLEQTAEEVRAVGEGELGPYRALASSLADGRELLDVAAAALKLAHTVQGRERTDEKEIAAPPPVRDRAPKHPPARSTKRTHPTARLWIDVGRQAGVRPADLMGAIVNETGLDPKAVGAIRIADRFSLVEVPAQAVDRLLASLRRTFIKGKKITVKRDGETG